MKTPYFIITVLVVIGFGLQEAAAQHRYIPFPDSNAIWVQRELDEFGNEKIQFVDQIIPIRDTTMFGKVYHLIWERDDPTTGKLEYQRWIGQDTSKRAVYLVHYFLVSPSMSWKEELLYDFSLKVGDTLPTLYGYSTSLAVVTKIDSGLLDKGYHYIYYFSNRSPYIEGIGSVTGLFGTGIFFEGGTELICVRLDGKSYFPANDSCMMPPPWNGIDGQDVTTKQAIIFPHPVTSNSVLKLKDTNEHIAELVLYDVQGKMILNQKRVNNSEIKIAEKVTFSGIYFYKIITTKGAIYSGKFTKNINS